MEETICPYKRVITPNKRYSRVDSTDEITFPKYNHYLCFTVTVRTNKFALKQNQKYSPEQEEIFKKIKSLHQSGLGYRKIAKQLNAEGITTHQGNRWEGKNVYSAIKRHKEREKRLEFINKEYEPEWSKIEVEFEKG